VLRLMNIRELLYLFRHDVLGEWPWSRFECNVSMMCGWCLAIPLRPESCTTKATPSGFIEARRSSYEYSLQRGPKEIPSKKQRSDRSGSL
jgi:hypothetical protein